MDNSINLKKIKYIELNLLVMYLVIIDVLFFPYIRSLTSSLGMLILPLWFIYNSKKIHLDKEFKIFFVIVFFVLLSFSSALINNYSQEIIKSSIINNVVLLYGLLYYFYGKFNFSNYNINLRVILQIYVTFGFILAIVYFYDASLYFELRNFWTMSGQTIQVNDSLSIFRYTATYSDPNNASVVYVSVLCYLLFNLQTKIFNDMIFMLMTLVILVATMSSTGFLLYVITILIYLLQNFKTIIQNITNVKFTTIFTVLLIVLTIPIIFLILSNYLFSSNIFGMSIERVTNNSSESRILIWEFLLENVNIFNYLFIGMGGAIGINGVVYPPHNGHLHLIYSYGLVVYISFMYIFFRFRSLNVSSYLFIFITFVGFTVNVGIYEIRFIALFALLVSSIYIPKTKYAK